jgi:GNAT superfamily N-acetyltransferase
MERDETSAHCIEVRRLGPADLDLVMRVPKGVFDDPIVPARTAEFLGDSRHILIGALADAAIVGFASAVVYVHPDKARPELWFNDIGLNDAFQRRGIGRRLMAEAVAQAHAAGCSVLWVQTEAENRSTREICKACGARESAGVMHYEIDLN